MNAFYETNDALRLEHTLRLLSRYDVSRWALSGGTAIELHLRRMGAAPFMRPLHDLDFIAASFDCLPAGLGDVVLSRHVHPHDPPAKTMLQAVYPDTGLRIDVFRAYGGEMERTQNIELVDSAFQIVAFEDLVARHARLCCDLLRGQSLAPKFARDLLRMLDFAKPDHIENVWREHRKIDHPPSFSEAANLLREAIAAHAELLVPTVYSTDVDEVCLRCQSTVAFRLADPGQVFAVLGYC
jgi:hypothetical protein